MNTPESTGNITQKAAQKRSFTEKILIRGGILLLLGLVFVEWSSRRNYDATLKSLEVAINTPNVPGNENGISLPDARKKIQGLAFEGEDLDHRPPRKTIQWPSLFKVYKVVLTVKDTDRVVSVDTGEPADVDPTGTNTSVKVAVPFPTEGLRKGYEGVVALDRLDLAKFTSPLGTGTLMRELIRQSVLLAAREEMGRLTCDAALGELLLDSNSPVGYPLQINLITNVDSRNTSVVKINIELLRPISSSKTFRWTSPEIVFTPADGIEGFVEKLESMSRTKFVEGLQKVGFEALNRKTDDKLVATPDFATQLDFVSQFAVLQSLHAQVDSPERLAGLVRAYANLGNLTDFHWSCESKAFKARSLLYAQRMVGKYGNSPMTLGHRAYARALTGRHATALVDIKAVRAGKAPAEPDWLDVIEAYAAFQPKVLENKTGPHKELATYLRMRLTDPHCDSRDTLDAVKNFAELNAASCSSAEILCDVPILEVQLSLRDSGFHRMWPAIYARLSAISNLPEKARRLAVEHREPGTATRFDGIELRRERQARLELIRELTQAAGGGDPREFSWDTLAHLIKEVSFVQSWRALNIILNVAHDSTNPMLANVAPLIEGHRFEKFLKGFSLNQGQSSKALIEFVKTVDHSALEVTTMPLYGFILQNVNFRLYNENPDLLERLKKSIVSHGDLIYEDLLVRPVYTQLRAISKDEARAVSPRQPRSIAVLISEDPDYAKPFWEKWEESYADNLCVLKALADRYQVSQRPQDAERCLNKANQLSAATFAAYLQMSRNCRARGDMEGYRKALEEALELPGTASEVAEIHSRLADYHIQRRDFESAAEHADFQVETLDAEAFFTAARCAEGLHHWDRAEAIWRRYSAGFGSTQPNWYYWCARTGTGDIASARAQAERYWQSLVPPYSDEQQLSRGLGFVLADEDRNAFDCFSSLAHGKYPYTYVVFQAALLNDKLGKTGPAAVLYKDAVGKQSQSIAKYELINRILVALKDPNQFRWNRNSFDEVIGKTQAFDATFIYYVAGLFLEIHGQHDEGQEYLQYAATSFDVRGSAFTGGEASCLLANHVLRSKGIEVGETRENEFPDALAPIITRLENAAKAIDDDRLDEAETLLNHAMKLQPDFTPTLLLHGKLNEARKNYKGAITDYEQVLKLNPESDGASTCLAMLLASCPEDEIRNGSQALKHAEKASNLRVLESWKLNEAMAAALAECGEFDKAVKLQLHTSQQNVVDRSLYERVKLYQGHKPYRRISVKSPKLP